MKLNVSAALRFTAAAAVVSLLASCAAGGPSDDPAADFYEGKTLEIVVPSAAGGGLDAIARLAADYMSDRLPGNPRVQVFNISGASAILGANEFYLNREHDGLSTIFVQSSAKISYALDAPGVEFDLRDLKPYFSLQMPRAFYVDTSAAATLEELLDPKEPLFLGAQSPTGVDVISLTGLNALGVSDNVEHIFGYENAGAIEEAFRGGEVNANAVVSNRVLNITPDFLESGKAEVLFTFGLPDGNGGLVRDPNFPDVPHIGEAYEILHGEPPSGPAWDAYMTVATNHTPGHFSFWTFNDIPESADQALTEFWADIADDPEFLAELEQVTDSDIFTIGEEAIAWGESLASPDPASIQFVKDYLTEQFDIDFD